MRIPPEIRKCVVFLGHRDSKGKIHLAGTGFLISKHFDSLETYLPFVVTARHVIDGIRSIGGTQVFIRFNRFDGSAAWHGIDTDEWISHHDDSDVDVALTLMTFPDTNVDHMVYPIESAATAERVGAERIDVGDDVFITGLFIHHYGNERNIPIVRVGNIAAMPEEKVSTGYLLMDAYLIEARSIGGLSGSPVFVHLGINRKVDGQVKEALRDEGAMYLLGLVHGHWDGRVSDLDMSAEDVARRDRVNMGIAIVVPVDKILEVLDQPMIKKVEEGLFKAKTRTEHSGSSKL